MGVNLDQGKQNSSSQRKIRVVQCTVTEPNKNDWKNPMEMVPVSGEFILSEFEFHWEFYSIF